MADLETKFKKILLMRFSIIIPIYNTEKYVDGCIRSILEQTYNDFELILVNDCSSDGTLKVIEQYDALDNVRIVDLKENHGQAYARNVGMDMAQGEYVMFIDSDDTIDVDTLETINKVIVNNPLVDMIKFICPNLKARNEYMNKLIPTDDFYIGKVKVDCLLGYTWSMVWRRDVIKHFRHKIEKGMCAELPFNYMCFNACNYFYVIDKDFYHYNKENPLAITKNVQYRNADSEYEIAKKIWFIIKEYNDWKPNFKQWIINDYKNLCNNCLCRNRRVQFQRFMKENS